MTFVSSPFFLQHLFFDVAITATALFFSWRLQSLVGARGERRAWALAAAAVAGGACGLAPWLILGGFDGTIWGFSLAARAVWTGATVAAPAAAAVASFRSRRALWLLPTVLLVGLKWWGEVGEPANLEIERATIVIPGLKGPVRIAHISDLQTDGIRPMELRARAAANDFGADVVVFTGDVMNHPAVKAAAYGYLAGFSARNAKLMVGGDVDGGLDRAAFESGTGFEWIDGKVRAVAVGPARVAFLGFGLRDFQKGAAFAERLVRLSGSPDARVALSHRPDAAFSLKGLPVPLLFSGHTHGGQLVIPGFGPPVTLTRVPRIVAAGGVHVFEGMTIALARGLGWEGHIAPRVRLFCRPHVLLVELVPPPR
jgi:predicted MPP superfamily phosphohydrolase